MYYDTFLTYLFMLIVMLTWFTHKVLYVEYMQLQQEKITSYGYPISLTVLFSLGVFWVYIAWDYARLLLS